MILGATFLMYHFGQVCSRILTIMPKVRRKTTIKKRKARNKQSLELQDHTRRQLKAIVSVGMGVVLLLALQDSAGSLGGAIGRGLKVLFGSWSMLFPMFLIGLGTLLLFASEPRVEQKRTWGPALSLLAFLGLVHLHTPVTGSIANELDTVAGAVGFMAAFPFITFLSIKVGYVVLSLLFVAGLFITFEPDIPAILRKLRPEETSKKVVRQRVAERSEAPQQEEVYGDLIEHGAKKDEEEHEEAEQPDLNIVRPAFAEKKIDMEEDAPPKAKVTPKPKQSGLIEMKDTRFEEWKFPEMELLESKHSELTVKDEDLKEQAVRIQQKLSEFDIAVTMKDAHPGPTVTQFTLQPAEGVKLSKIGSLKDDLALALAATSLRIEAPIPGKSLVGIEMPNIVRSTVYLRELLESNAFRQSDSPLTIPLGRGVSGDAMVATIEDMPHLLIAGATGAGKSVCMNTFLISLLFQNAPHELKFILIDPKRVELMPYNGIPHLLTPVITESEKALQALRWAIAEMGRRLHKFSESGVRNLAEYNEKQENEELILPRIVIVIDELADLMMRQHRKDTETMIARIAQMARAVGMHLIIATQRPSVDVITGLIKANIPTRIAFRVVSAIDSRTILDSIGAEDLLGKGDMLYMTASTPNPVRIQGIYISTKEVERVINAVKVAGGGMLTEEITLGDGNEQNNAVTGGTSSIDLDADDNGGDDLFFDAVRIVQASQKASASLLQRQLKVGYARAARLLDIMEEKGLVGPADGAKARKIYMDKAQV